MDIMIAYIVSGLMMVVCGILAKIISDFNNIYYGDINTFYVPAVCILCIGIVFSVGIISSVSHENDMTAQALSDFNTHNVNLDLYFEDDIYKTVIDKELMKAQVYNSTVVLADFIKK